LLAAALYSLFRGIERDITPEAGEFGELLLGVRRLIGSTTSKTARTILFIHRR
jgi:hypothetical protein